MALGLLTRREVTSCSSLPPLLPLHHAAGEAGASQDDAPGPGIPGRLKSQHPQIPQQEKTINQLLLDGLLMIKALSSPSTVIQMPLPSGRVGWPSLALHVPGPWLEPVVQWNRAQHSHSTLRAQTALCSQREQPQQPCPSMLPYPPTHR